MASTPLSPLCSGPVVPQGVAQILSLDREGEHCRTNEPEVNFPLEESRSAPLESIRAVRRHPPGATVVILVIVILALVRPPAVATAFQYRKEDRELLAPEKLCVSGSGQARPCPSTPEEVKAYDAVMMDEYGYVNVKLTDVKMRDDGRRRHVDLAEEFYLKGRWLWKRGLENKSGKDEDGSLQSTKKPIDEDPPSSSAAAQSLAHHLQVYLVSLDHYRDVVSQSQCCYELEFGPPFPAWLKNETINGVTRPVLPKECTFNDPTGARTNGKKTKTKKADESPRKFAHDYRVNAPRIGPRQATSAPMTINSDDGVHIVAKLKPETKGRSKHMVVISNCAAEIYVDSHTNTTRHTPLKAVIGKVEITFVSKFGELPLSMMGIIPFYGVVMGLYAVLTLAWWKRSRGSRGNGSNRRAYSPPMPMLGLQRAIHYLVVAQFVFSAIAFTYYLHLNGTSVDVDVLYSGTAAALVNWGPWSMVVAIAHFVTLLACQVVVTLATDGTWLIQHSVRPTTKNALYCLGGMWLVYFVLYGFLSPNLRSYILMMFGLTWVGFLLFNVRRSLRHLRSLMIGQGNETVMAVGGALVAKRSLYRKMFAVVAIYPIVFLVSLLWNSNSRQDSWTWVGYVLGDIYLFIILFHASILWMPRPMASQEYVKYAPLEMSVVAHNDLDLWEENIGEAWGEEEIELDHPMKIS